MTTMPATIQERIPMSIHAPVRPGATAFSMTPSDIIGILKKRLFMILFIWIAVTALAIGGTFYLIKEHPKYTAYSLVQVESPFIRPPMQLVEQGVNVDLMDRYVSDQMVLIRDQQILREALTSADILETEWYKNQPDKTLVLSELEDGLSVKQVPESNYLRVAFSTKNKEDGPRIVNTVIQKYLTKVQSDSQLQYKDEMAEYTRNQENLKTQLETIRARKQEFVATLNTAGITEGLNVVGETWRALSAEVTRLESEKLQFKTAHENLVGVDPSQIAISPQMDLMIQQDNEVATLQNNLSIFKQGRLTLLQKGFGDNHRQVVDLDTRINVLKEELAAVRAEKEAKIREYQINQAHTNFLNAAQAEIHLRERMFEAEAQQRALDRGLAEYRNLLDEQFMVEEQLRQIEEYIYQLRLMIKDRGMVRVRQAGQALPPLERSFPRWELNVPAGVLFGLFLGIGIAMLLELVDTSVKTTRDIIRYVNVPILGTVPDLDDEEVHIDKIELASYTTPRSMIAEAFRKFRTNLLLSSPAERQRSVLVTSSKPEEGKTTVAINLAISVGQSGRRVLLVDANFHRPALKQIFPNIPHEGLSNVLIGQAKVDALVTATDLPNLDVLGSGPIPPNPAELLAGSYLKEMITQAAQRYDQIIFDGPPVLLVTDALVMADIVDGVILVCRAQQVSRGVVQRAREQLERVNGRIFGAILNAAQVARGGYFREQMRTYYDYQPEALASDLTRTLPREGEVKNGDSKEV